MPLELLSTRLRTDGCHLLGFVNTRSVISRPSDVSSPMLLRLTRPYYCSSWLKHLGCLTLLPASLRGLIPPVLPLSLLKHCRRQMALKWLRLVEALICGTEHLFDTAAHRRVLSFDQQRGGPVPKSAQRPAVCVVKRIKALTRQHCKDYIMRQSAGPLPPQQVHEGHFRLSVLKMAPLVLFLRHLL